MLKRADKLENTVWRHVEDRGLITKGQTVGVAVSGGADSMALLVSLHILSKTRGFDLKVLHYEHGIRGTESLRDASFVREQCEHLDVEFILESADIPAMARERHVGLELAARDARRSFFETVVRQGKVDVVATAHHQGDNAESVLMHILRGSGLNGLCGISPREGFLIRPLLCVSRSEILEYLARKETKWVQDSTNFDVSYDRNYVRSVLLPSIEGRLNPRVQDALCRLAQCAATDADYLDAVAKEQFAMCQASKSRDTIGLDAALLSDLHPAIAARVIQLALSEIGRRQDVEQNHVQALMKLAAANATGTGIDLGQGIRARIEYGRLMLERQQTAQSIQGYELKLTIPSIVQLPAGASIETTLVPERLSDTRGSLREYADADKIPAEAVVRTRRPGDRIRVLNAPGHKKLKDYFIDEKLPQGKRDSVPLLAAGSDILWVIGHALSEDIRVDSATKRICRLTYRDSAAC